MNENEGRQLLSELLSKVNASGPENFDEVPVEESAASLVAGKDDESSSLEKSLISMDSRLYVESSSPICGNPRLRSITVSFLQTQLVSARFPKTDYVQVLVNRESKILALRPCEEGARDSFLWCSVSKGKRKPRQITCKLFFAKIVSMMDWTPTTVIRCSVG